MNSETLSPEQQYTGRTLVPDHALILERWRNTSALFRSTANADLNVRYGNSERHYFDFFRAENARGTLVFIHGGYWRSLDKSDFSFVAAPFIEAGLSVALLNYRLCPAVSVREIIGDCQDAIAWLIANAARHAIPVQRIALSGHSAGGHLTAMLFATDWAQRGIDSRCFVGGVALSGLFDLIPLMQTSFNDDLQLVSAQQANTVSPLCLSPYISAPFYLAVGAAESDAFKWQTQQLKNAWTDICSQAIVADANHFTIVDHFAASGSSSFRFIEQLFK
jgi:arylformamidase